MFAQFLWTLRFIFSRSHEKLFLVLFQGTKYKKDWHILQIILVQGLLSIQNWNSSHSWTKYRNYFCQYFFYYYYYLFVYFEDQSRRWRKILHIRASKIAGFARQRRSQINNMCSLCFLFSCAILLPPWYTASKLMCIHKSVLLVFESRVNITFVN